MANVVEKIKELLEVEDLDVNLKFKELEEWDSLSVLSVLAMVDSDYGMNMSQAEVENFTSISEFIKHIEANAK